MLSFPTPVFAHCTPPPQVGPFVLLVDDHETCLVLLRGVIESAGLPCVTASSATDALVYCDAQAPQAVVTDLSMPGLDGDILSHWLKARYPDLPLILITGEDLDAAAATRLLESFAAILPKPVDPAKLLALLEELIQHAPESETKLALP